MKKNKYNPLTSFKNMESFYNISENKKESIMKKIAIGIALAFTFVIALSATKDIGSDLQQLSSDQDKCCLPSIDDIEWLETKASVAFILLNGPSKDINNILSTKLKSVCSELNESKSSADYIILEENHKHYAEIVKKFSVKSFPAIVSIGHGCNTSVLENDINTTALVKAYISASTSTCCALSCCMETINSRCLKNKNSTCSKENTSCCFLCNHFCCSKS